MSTAARHVHYTYGEYLALEEQSPTRHEYLDGEIYAMAGGSPDHAALAASMIRLLGASLRSGCRVFTSDLRVRIPASGLSTYPDVAVVCGPSLRAADDALAVVNPILLVEVTSPSTEEYDRGEKLRQYQQISGLAEILIVSHQEPRITSFQRAADGRWTVAEARWGQTLALTSTGGTLVVDDLYRDGLEDASRS